LKGPPILFIIRPWIDAWILWRMINGTTRTQDQGQREKMRRVCQTLNNY